MAALGLIPISRFRTLLAQNPLPNLQQRRFSVPLLDDQGRITSRFDASSLYFLEDLGEGVTLEMAQVPGGTFQMGSDNLAPLFEDAEQPIHQVSISPFSLGTYAVTRGQWRQVSTFPSVSQDLGQLYRLDMPLEIENQLPVDIVFFQEAEEFCARLRSRTGRAYRLPSESEWEYACRAGTKTSYHFGDSITLEVANYNDLQRPLGLTVVGSKQSPNRFGLHDMHGNVQEWCIDWSHSDYMGAPTDGTAWVDQGNFRITRGGMFLWNSERARSAARTSSDIRGTSSGTGFRVALSVANQSFDPQFSSADVVNAASQSAGSIAPGEIVTIFGISVGPTIPTSITFDGSGLVGKDLGGTQVLFDGVPAPLLYASATQVNAVVPYGLGQKATTEIIVYTRGQSSAPVLVPLADSAPALFTTDGSGEGQGAILNEDGSPNSVNNPARRGSIVTLFATGEGQTNPPGVDGKLAAAPFPAPVLPVQLLIGQVSAEVDYAGAAPEQIAGLLQINAIIPDTIPTGSQPVNVKIGSASSPVGVFVVVG